MDSHGRSQGAIPMDDSQGDRNEDDGDPDSNQRPQRPIFDFTRPILAGSAAMAARQPSYIGPRDTYGVPPHMRPPEQTSEILVKVTFIEKRTEPFQLKVNNTRNGQHLQDECKRKFEEKGWTWNNVRILFRGAEIRPETDLSQIRGLVNNAEVQLVCTVPPPRPLSVRVQGRNMPEVAAELNSLIQRHGRSANRTVTPYDRTTASAEPRRSPAYQRYNNCNILARNFEACIQASQENARPEDRVRHNEPVVITPDNPSVVDFGHHIIQLSGKIREFAVQLSRLSDLLVRDPVIENNDDKEFIRRLVQNNMDATRYFSPYLKNMVKMCIPLIAEPPRSLLVTNETETNRN